MAEFRSKSAIYQTSPERLGAPFAFSGGLPAQERRDIKLIVIRRYMHGRRSAVDVQALRGSPFGVFRDRIGAS
jgi:hypothetical protein